jgi:hypothetical protein
MHQRTLRSGSTIETQAQLPKLTQEQRRLGNIRWICQPPQGHIGEEVLDILGREGNADECLEQTCSAQQREQTVDADLLRAIFGSEALCRLSAVSSATTSEKGKIIMDLSSSQGTGRRSRAKKKNI